MDQYITSHYRLTIMFWSIKVMQELAHLTRQVSTTETKEPKTTKPKQWQQDEALAMAAGVVATGTTQWDIFPELCLVNHCCQSLQFDFCWGTALDITALTCIGFELTTNLQFR
jgi:5-methylcytosine-specific restriction endonuclease McrA